MAQGLIDNYGYAIPGLIQQSAYISAVDTGIADVYALALSPPVTQYYNNMLVVFAPANTNATTTPTVNVNGLGARTIVKNNGAVAANDLVSGVNALLIYSVANSNFELVNPQTIVASGVSAAQIQQQAVTYAPDTSGAPASAITIAPSPAYGSYVVGDIVQFSTTFGGNSGSVTLNVNGLGAKPLYNMAAQGLSGGEIINYVVYTAIYSPGFMGDYFVLLNPSNTPSVLNIQSGYNAAPDIGAVNAYGIALTPAYPNSYARGMIVIVDGIANTNTGASTLFAGAAGAIPIVTPNGNPLVGGELVSGGSYQFLFSYVIYSWVLLNSSLTPTTLQVQQQAFNVVTDSGGAANAYVGAYSPVISNYGAYPGVTFSLTALNATNTGASTLDAGAGADPILTPDGNPLVGGEMVAGGTYYFLLAASGWQLLNSSLSGLDYVSSVISAGTPVSVSTMTPTNITSIVVGIGTWEIPANTSFAFTGAPTGAACWVSTTSATIPDFSLYSAIENAAGIGSVGFTAPPFRITVAVPTTVYLSAQAAFSTGSCSVSGGIYASRVKP